MARVGEEMRARFGSRAEVISQVVAGERHISVLPFHASYDLRAAFGG